jgi:hypothetical protein
MNEFSQSELVAHTNITFCIVPLSQLLHKLQLLSKNSSQSLMPILSYYIVLSFSHTCPYVNISVQNK